MATIANYPVPSAGGPVINRLVTQTREFKNDLTVNDDGTIDVNVQPCGIRRWQLEYDGLSESDAAALDNHFNSANGDANDFSFVNPRDSITYTAVRYEKYEVPRHPRKWALIRRVTLIRRP